MLKLSLVWMHIRTSLSSSSGFQTAFFIFKVTCGGSFCGLALGAHPPTELKYVILSSQRLLSSPSPPPRSLCLEMSSLNGALARGHVKGGLLPIRMNSKSGSAFCLAMDMLCLDDMFCLFL